MFQSGDQHPGFGSSAFRWVCIGMLFCILGTPSYSAANDYDVVIYGGTSGGITAAIQTARMGKSVALVEPGEHLGGLTSGGLGATDIGNKRAIGGLSREFYRRVKLHYEQGHAWTAEKPESYVNRRQNANEDTMWFFEPHVAEALFRDWLGEYPAIEVFERERLDRGTGVKGQAGQILSITMESGKVFSAKVFIDATYEGDLLAAAGVDYIVGRESNATYGETLNGVQTAYAKHHQLVPGVDPYVKSGQPSSGLLPGIDPQGPGDEGNGDHRVQAYCLRMCVTDHAENQIPFQKPDNYDPLAYELLFRNFEAGANVAPWHPLLMPNRKTDANNNRGVSTDFIGESYSWPEASYEERAAIYQKHLRYQQGLMWTLANHPRVPEPIRNQVSRWGNCKDEFQAQGGWSHQLYVREARRMKGVEVMTQHHCQGRSVADRPVGLAAYTMDSHHVQRYVDQNGQVQNEGDVQVGGFPPYPIGYGSLLPKQEQCRNLLVPVCLSASHIAYGSIRMEPVFMVLGQSAATAACLAIEGNVPLHELDYRILRERLAEDQQILAWTAPVIRRQSVDLKDLKGQIMDSDQAMLRGVWLPSQSVDWFVGQDYLHDNHQAKGQAFALFQFPELPSGRYSVRIAYTPHENRASNVPVTVRVGATRSTKRINQRVQPKIEKAFVELGQFSVKDQEGLAVEVSNEDTDGFVVVDAVWVLPLEP